MDQEIATHMCTIPPELLLNIFLFLPSQELIKCRRVCSRWKLIIDRLSKSVELWLRSCKRDFSRIYRSARSKSGPELSWFNLYKSLCLWARLADAREERDEFASASGVMCEIRGFQILFNGVIGVHTKSSIVYYDSKTLEVSKRGPINGSFSRYAENDSIILILNYQLQLFAIRTRLVNTWDQNDTLFYNVKLFTFTDNEIYYVTLNDEIYICKLYGNNGLLQATFITQSEDCVMALGCTNSQLNILTFARNIYTVVNNNFVFACTIGPDSNLLHQLQRYNLLDQMDWRVYLQWMYVFNRSIPEGPFRDLTIIKQYGNIFFAGTNFGVFRIYYAPHTNEEFDLFNMEPIKQYNFMERSDCPVLSTCPILSIDVIEVEDGHRILISMPKKIAVVNLSHDFKRTESLAMLPYSEVQKVKQLKINSS